MPYRNNLKSALYYYCEQAHKDALLSKQKENNMDLQTFKAESNRLTAESKRLSAMQSRNHIEYLNGTITETEWQNRSQELNNRKLVLTKKWDALSVSS